VMGIGYTAPPLKLSYRTWGELDVALTHSVLMVLLGCFSQGGMAELQQWLIAAPMLFAILPAIILAGFPDLEADVAAGKQTLVVRFGRRAAAGVAIGATFVAAILHAGLFVSPWWFFLALLIHCSLLMLALATCMRQQRAGRMNGLLALALSYMLWFVWVPWLPSH
jgi:1,4-dihydroxy-2-naphthoate octaprenyltransferase